MGVHFESFRCAVEAIQVVTETVGLGGVATEMLEHARGSVEAIETVAEGSNPQHAGAIFKNDVGNFSKTLRVLRIVPVANKGSSLAVVVIEPRGCSNSCRSCTVNVQCADGVISKAVGVLGIVGKVVEDVQFRIA